MNFEYFIILIFILLSMMLSFFLFLIIITLIYSKFDIEKVSSYECGFHPFEDTRHNYNIRFYLVAILFLIFDLEIIFLFPWLTLVNLLAIPGFIVIFIFISILIIGFIYEWFKGALVWE